MRILKHGRTFLSALLIILCLTSDFIIGQEMKFIATDNKDVFYHYNKNDSSFVFKLTYKKQSHEFIVGLNLTIHIDSITDIKLLEIPYNEKEKLFLITVPKVYIKELLASKTIDLYTEVHEISNADGYIKSSYERCLSGKIIKQNIE